MDTVAFQLQAHGLSDHFQMMVPRLSALMGMTCFAFGKVDAKVEGFKSGARFRTKKVSAAWDWCSLVRDAMIRTDGHVYEAVIARVDDPIFIYSCCHFPSRTHVDPENAHKLAKDAVFHKKTGGDKYTGGFYDPPMYHDASTPLFEIGLFRCTV